MKQTDYELSRIVTLMGTAFLLWLIYALATAGQRGLRGELR